MQNFARLVQGAHFQIGVELRGYENVRFSMKNWPYLGNGERYSQDYFNH